MDGYEKVNYAAIYLSMLLLSTSCQKEIQKNSAQRSEEIQTGAPPSGSGECNIDYNIDSVGYALCNLNSAGEEVLRLAQNNDFRQTVYSLIDDQFDKDDDVLIKTLLPKCGNGGIPAATQKLIDALIAFQNINGDTLYPQIYIPNYEELKSKGLLGVSNPIVIPYANQEDPNDEYVGYTLDQNGNFIQLQNKIREANFFTNELWIISLNEVVNRMAVPEDEQGAGQVGETQGTYDGYIQKITPKVLLEKWIAGKPELCIRTVRTTGNGYFYGTTTPVDVYPCTRYSDNIKGHLIKKYKRSEVSNEMEVNYVVQYDWEDQSFYEQGVALHYVLFERDRWPAPRRSAVTTLDVGSPPQQRVIEFRSSELQFNSGVLYSNFFNDPPFSHPQIKYIHGTLFEDDRIKFNTLFY